MSNKRDRNQKLSQKHSKSPFKLILNTPSLCLEKNLSNLFKLSTLPPLTLTLLIFASIYHDALASETQFEENSKDKYLYGIEIDSSTQNSWTANGPINLSTNVDKDSPIE